MDINEQILENEKLVHFVINKFFNSLVQDEDIIQIGRIGLWKAIETYETNKGSFSTYAVSCIKNEIAREIRARMSKKRAIEETKLCHIDDEKNFIELAENKNMEEQIHDKIMLKEIIKELDEEERQIMELKSRGYRHKIIAENLGLKEYQVTRKIDKCRRKMKKRHKEYLKDVL